MGFCLCVCLLSSFLFERIHYFCLMYSGVCCNESLVWFEVSGFWDTINTGSSRLSCCCLCHGNSTALDQQDQWPLYMLQQFTDDIDFGVSQLKASDLGLGGN